MAQTQKAHIRDLVIVLSKILLQNRGKLERSLISVLNRIQEKQEGPEALPPSEPIPDPPPAPKPELDNQKPDTTGGIHMDKKPIRNPNLDKPLPAPSFELPEEELTGLLAQESLLPIKGIDRTRQQCLRQLGIQTPADLLKKARTIAQRKALVPQLIALEREKDPDAPAEGFSEYRYERYLASWVRQADLYRAKGMDEDTAYLLVQLGVRHLEDLAKLDADKVYPMLLGLHQAQPQYDVISRDQLAAIIDGARDRAGEDPEKQQRLQALLQQALLNTASKVPGHGLDRYTEQLLRLLNDNLMDISVSDILGSGSYLECDDPAPEYLFLEEDLSPELKVDPVDIPTVTNLEKIRSGLEALKEIPRELQPIRYIRGRVFLLKPGQTLPDKESERMYYALYDAKIEVDGCAASSTDPQTTNEKPHAYTDGSGRFTIELPEKANLCQTVTLIVSQDRCQQKFSFSAGTLLASCPERKTMALIDEMDLIYEDLTQDQAMYDSLLQIKNHIEAGQTVTEEDLRFYQTHTKTDLYTGRSKMEALQESISQNEERLRTLRSEICSTDPTTNELDRILRNLTDRDSITADLSDQPLVVNEAVFRKLRTDQPKVMPSVKLMEQDNAPVYLPTDTAPSKIYQYSMLQRLVEPDLHRPTNVNGGGAAVTGRESINQPIDVRSFRDNLAKNHAELSYMSSLGIGYTLNMHQAWVPDGFALGTLLYSLVLAPGEEQRLIVRENKQSYALMEEASGTDRVGESYELSQLDTTDAMFRNALEQMMSGNSDFSTKSSSWSIGGSGSYGGGGFGVGLSGGYGSSSSKGSASASQRNTHSEASSAAQSFQHGIKMASEKLSQAKRLSISMATSAVEESAATRIIANHNHSHTMTVQYWEVMRRYRLETCVDSVDLVLFVPVKPICFAPTGENIALSDITKKDGTPVTAFQGRYQALLNNADILESALPNKYRTGLNVIRKYSAMENWSVEEGSNGSTEVAMTFSGYFLSCDHLSATLVLKHGKGSVHGQVNLGKMHLASTFTTSQDVFEAIRTIRNAADDNAVKPLIDGETATNTHTCTFTLPEGVSTLDINYIRLNYSCEPLSYYLSKDDGAMAANGNTAQEAYEKMWDRMWDLAKDTDNSNNDKTMIAYYREALPESWISPNVTVSPAKIKSLGNVYVKLSGVTVGGNAFMAALSSPKLGSGTTVSLWNPSIIMSRSELQKAEETLQHVMNNTMRYSQAVWNSLSLNERAMLLDQFTIHMDNWQGEETNASDTNIPLLNCINVHKLLGFYGNCMLFPFTYPEALAQEIGMTAAELQETLFRHHTNNFRVPVTTISVPTDGMIGEAVLGATNVSEEIDLTRFWNWSDSPIDKMELNAAALKDTDYLKDKNTLSLSALNLSGATNPTSVTVPDLVKALVDRKLPEFDDLTGQQYLKELMTGTASSADAARSAALSTSNDAMKTALSHVEKMQTAENDLTKAYLAKGLDKDGTPLKKADGTGGPGSGGGAGGTGSGGTGSGGSGGAGGGKGGSAGTPTASGGGKTAEILINYYNGTAGVTTVAQGSGKTDSKPSAPSDGANDAPSAKPKDPNTNPADANK